MTSNIGVMALTRAVNRLAPDHDDWRTRAACADPTVDAEWFYEKDGERDARAICAGCPVSALCLADALDVEGRSRVSSRFGIRGGLDPQQRVDRARRQGRKGIA